MSAPLEPGFPERPPARRMRGQAAARVARLARKELREILRDRRTIVTLVLMPLLVYPLLSLAFQQLLVPKKAATAPETFHVGVESEQWVKIVEHALRQGSQVLSQRPRIESGAPAAEEKSSAATLGKTELDDRSEPHVEPSADLERDVAAGAFDLGIRIRPLDTRPLPEGDPPYGIELIYREDDSYSVRLLRQVERRIEANNQNRLQMRLAHLNASGMPPAIVQRKVVAAAGGGSSSLKTLLPLILVLMTITGAVYPAIDLTAGERERGTLEMLIAAPVARIELMLGKYVAVLTVALLTATANLVAMSATILSMGLGPVVLGPAGLTPAVVAQVFGLMVLFAAFFSAVLLAVTSFARSFKEAQAYLIPLMMVSIAPGLLSLKPDLKLSGILAVTPLANIVLLARDLFAGTPVEPMMAAVTIASTALFAVAALGLAARIFGADAILYGSQGSWSDLGRGPAEPQPTARVSGALFCLALLFPALFLVNNVLAQMAGGSLEWTLILRGLAQLALFAGFPLAAAWLGRVRLGRGFALRPASVWGFLGAALLGLSLWPFAAQIFALSRDLGLARFDAESLRKIQEWIEAQRQLPPAWIVLTYGFLPALSEELFFRGYLYGALRARLSTLATILSSSLLFGAFHLIATDSLAIERLLPTTAIGLALACVRWRTGSVLPGMLLHALHNSLLLLLIYYHKELSDHGIGQTEGDYLPWTWLAAGGATAAIGGLLVILSSPRTFSAASS